MKKDLALMPARFHSPGR